MYNPYGYPPVYSPQAPQFAPFAPGMVNTPGGYQNPAQPPVQPAQPGAMPVVLQVPTIKQVEQAPVQPGGKALVLVANEPTIAMRTADNMGITTTDYYHIERFDPDAPAAAPAGDFVTRAEFQQAMAGMAQQLQQAQRPAAAPATGEKEAAKR